MCPDVAKALARVSGGLYIGAPRPAAYRAWAGWAPSWLGRKLAGLQGQRCGAAPPEPLPTSAPRTCPPAVTAGRNDAKSAMVASWVSQASFEPLGLTIAVAKDRAIESLMQVGPPAGAGCGG